MTTVERVLRRAVAEPDAARRLRALLALWPRLPTPELAAAIGAVGAALAAGDVRPEPRGYDEWMACARAHQPEELERLLPRAREGAEHQKLEALLRWPPDPRIAAAISGASDARTRALIEQLRARHGARGAHTPAALAALLAPLTTTPPSHEALWRAVRADATDAAARAVLRDALLADGDLRGELMALQSTPGAADPRTRPGRRVRALLAAQRTRWLGRLRAHVFEDECEWVHGLLDKVAVRDSPARTPPSPEALTVTRCQVDALVFPDWVWQLPQLRTITASTISRRLPRQVLAPVERVSLRIADAWLLEWLYVVSALPRLRQLEVELVARPEGLPQAPMMYASMIFQWPGTSDVRVTLSAHRRGTMQLERAGGQWRRLA